MAKKLNYCQAHWSLYLVCFNFMLAHCPDHSIGKSDILSWRPDYSTGTSDNKDVTLLRLEMFAIWALEGVELEGAKKNMLSNIHKGNCNRDQEESIAQVACELQQSSSWMVHSIEWSNVDSLLQFQGKIYVPWNLELHRHIVSLYHDTKIAGHPGQWKTLELVSWNYW